MGGWLSIVTVCMDWWVVKYCYSTHGLMGPWTGGLLSTAVRMDWSRLRLDNKYCCRLVGGLGLLQYK